MDGRRENIPKKGNKNNTASTSKESKTTKDRIKKEMNPSRNVDAGGRVACSGGNIFQTLEPTRIEATKIKNHQDQTDEMDRKNKHYKLNGASDEEETTLHQGTQWAMMITIGIAMYTLATHETQETVQEKSSLPLPTVAASTHDGKNDATTAQHQATYATHPHLPPRRSQRNKPVLVNRTSPGAHGEPQEKLINNKGNVSAIEKYAGSTAKNAGSTV